MNRIELMKTGRYAEGQRSRQKALDFIIANPGALSPDVAEYMKEDKSVTADRLRFMSDNGDLSRELINRKYTNAAGKKCNTSVYSYTALREKATAPVEVIEEKARRESQGTHRAQALNAMKTVEPWLTRNVDPDRKAKRNPDAQHSGMPRVFVGSMG